MSFSVISDCLIVCNVDHTDGHYMPLYNPVSYKHVKFPLGITLMDITCFITCFIITHFIIIQLFSCKEAAPEVQMLRCVCVCV